MNISMEKVLVVVILVVLVFAVSCSSSNKSPVVPDTTIQSDSNTGNLSNHWLWGYWEASIPDTHDRIEVVPVRGTSIHMNVRRFLEFQPCDDCLKITELSINPDLEKISAQVQLRHPFPGLDKYTGFNLRLVVISDGSRYFPELDARVPDAALGDFTMLDPAGYTRFWNTVEYPEGSGDWKILEYSRGNYASPGGFTGTVNPFTTCPSDERMSVEAGSVQYVDVYMNLPTGPIKFGYAVDASWEPPLVDPPVDIINDFPSSANSLEPVFAEWHQYDPLDTDAGDTASASVYLWDFQGIETLESVVIECPDLWNGVIEPDLIYPGESIEYGDNVISDFTLVNELGAPEGEYPALIKTYDIGSDIYSGDVCNMYYIVNISVVENLDPEFEGKIAFMAPGPDDPWGGPGANNVWIYDFDDCSETQLTDFFGVGYLFHEIRINPAGTHHLHCAGPTPYYSDVMVYELASGDHWSASPTDEVDDFGDFHPDGEHILAASGTEWGNTPNLMTMKYDGSERTHLVTAPDTIMQPRWSPDGTKIAMILSAQFTDPPSSELWIYDTVSESFHEIMAADGLEEFPCWCPVQNDGVYYLAFQSNREHHPDYETDIYIVNPETEDIILHYDTGVAETCPSFSPDGQSFVYNATDGNDEELWVYSWTNDELMQLTDDDTYDSYAAWSWNW